MAKACYWKKSVPLVLLGLSLAAIVGGRVYSQQGKEAPAKRHPLAESDGSHPDSEPGPKFTLNLTPTYKSEQLTPVPEPEHSPTGTPAEPTLVSQRESSMSADADNAKSESNALFLAGSADKSEDQHQGQKIPFAGQPAEGTDAGRAAPGESPKETQSPIVRTAAAIPAPRAEGKASIQVVPPYTTSLGTQTASISVDWVTPDSVLVGQEGLYELVVRNRGRIGVEQIVVEQVLPEGFRLIAAEPKPDRAGAEPSWRIRQLNPQEESRIKLRLVPEKVGEAQSHARVNFSTSSMASFRVVEPKLELIAEAPEKVIVGNQAVFHLTVRNPGTGKTTNAAVEIQLPDAMTPLRDEAVYSLGVLSPGESRSIRVVAKVSELGNHDCKFIATADHGLRDEATTRVNALGGKLALAIDGPSFRYVGRPAHYSIRIKNEGTAPAHNVNLACRVPKAFAYVGAGRSGRFDSNSKNINWFIGTLDVGEQFQGEFTLRAESRGEIPILAEAEAEQGLHAKTAHVTKVEGIAAILLEVVDVDDPVEVGAETSYEVLVTNQGTDFARNVAISATVPAGMEITGAKGPSRWQIDGRTIRFKQLPKLAPLADAIYRIKVRSSQPGDRRIEVRAEADTLDSPVTELESTKIYQDQ